MTLRKQWFETEEWVRMEGDMFFYNKPLKLPQDELELFSNRFFKRIGTMVKVMTGPIANHPHAKLLWWCWLNLDPEQQDYMRERDLDNVIQRAHMAFAYHPGVVASMLNRYHYMNEYWDPVKWITLIHDISPRCIVRMDREKYLDIFHEYQKDPLAARIRNLAIQYDGTNVDDVLRYVGEQHAVVSHTADRLILEAPKGNAQILKDHFIWFKDGYIKHGGIKAFMSERLKYINKADAPGFWIKPSDREANDPILHTNLCQEVAV